MVATAAVGAALPEGEAPSYSDRMIHLYDTHMLLALQHLAIRTGTGVPGLADPAGPGEPAQPGCVGSIQRTSSGGSAGSMSRLTATACPSLRTSTHSSTSVRLALISWWGTKGGT